MIGYIKLHRQIIDWEWYEDANAFRLFIHCLLKSNHSDKEWRGIKISRGQFHTSIGILASELKISDKAVRIAIEKLIRTKEIETKGANNGTMITICNYETYQRFEDSEGRAKGRTKGKPRATTNNDNTLEENEEINNIKNSCFSFEEFWEVYPQKKCKADAEKKYSKLSETEREAIKNTINDFIVNVPFKDYNHPNPNTYINQKRWMDSQGQQQLDIFARKPKTDEYE